MRHHILSLLSLAIGLVGLTGCLVAIACVWMVETRLVHLTERVLGLVDGSLTRVGERLEQSQNQVQTLRITATEVEQGLKDWAKLESSERLKSRLGIEEKADRVVSGIRQADHWIETTESVVQLMQQALELGNSIGVPAHAELADGLLEELASLRGQMQQALAQFDQIREWTDEMNGRTLRDEDLGHVVQLSARIIATFGFIDTGLAGLEERLSVTVDTMRTTRTDCVWWIRITALATSLLIGWMATGQFSLSFHGWRRLNQRCSMTSRRPQEA